ncbi:MAG: hypothetical protein NC253_00505 [Ruminococcus sp.]|nr:hypothetical protein [Ruminococcus sp.]MCM1380603.1 hypothetical protein [Muribaculaceae bacterium]MCM1478109.1 hypothetical protein [Muribaculaceae bacterium]
MLISEYMLRNASVTTGKVGSVQNPQNPIGGSTAVNPQNSDFAQELKKQLEQLNSESGVQFSKHAMDRISERNIDLSADNKLDRLNRAVTLAGEKGSDDALVMIDSTAFVVSVKNNKVITTLTADDMQGSIFTNIDSTVIM